MKTALWLCAAWCVACGMGSMRAQDASAPPEAAVGPEAVKALFKHYALNPLAKDPKTQQPLRTDGSWLIGKSRPAACPQTTQTCVEVFYTVPSQGAKCEWVIALNADGTDGAVVAKNEDAEKYLVRALTAKEAKPFVQSRSRPEYIPIAKAMRAGGDVVVKVLVGTSGEVEDAHIVSGSPVIQQVSLEAAKKWKFLPMKVGDRAVEYEVQIVFSFYIATESVKMTP